MGSTRTRARVWLDLQEHSVRQILTSASPARVKMAGHARMKLMTSTVSVKKNTRGCSAKLVSLMFSLCLFLFLKCIYLVRFLVI